MLHPGGCGGLFCQIHISVSKNRRALAVAKGLLSIGAGYGEINSCTLKSLSASCQTRPALQPAARARSWNWLIEYL